MVEHGGEHTKKVLLKHGFEGKTYKDKKGESFVGYSKSAKSKALERKKGSADHINAERKRQGYKPMSAQDKRIHEGMDKYL